MAKDGDFSEASYMFGILSIVFAFFQPIAGFILGIVGFLHARKQKTPLSNKAKKLSIIGIVLSIILFAVAIVSTFYLTKLGLGNLPIR